MTVRDDILKKLDENRGSFLSGQKLADSLCVSRNAVWKAVGDLKRQGYPIKAIPNKGYILSKDTDIISSQGIQKYLNKEKETFFFEVFDVMESTNDYLKRDPKEEGHVVISKKQLKGKGRMGRAFYSPENTGLYFSLSLKPNIEAEKAILITIMAAVSVAEAIEKITGEKVKIKWVNDLFLRNRKVCGILTEGNIDLESNNLSYAVLGIGVNLIEPEKGFPENIRDSAGYIFTRDNKPDDIKNAFIASVLEIFYGYYTIFSAENFMKGYRERSMLIGEEIHIHSSGGRPRKARAVGIDDYGRLIVKNQKGELEKLNSGEVSIRKKAED